MIYFAIALLVYSLIITVIAVRDMLIRKSFFRYRLTFLILIIFILTLILFFYSDISKHPTYLNAIYYLLFIIFVLLSVLLFLVTRTNLVKRELENVMFDAFSASTYTLFVNKNNKIEQISDSMLKELGINDPSLVIGQNIIDVLSSCLRLEGINDFEYKTKKDLEFVFNIRRNTTELNHSKLTYYNQNGIYTTLILYQKEIYNNQKYVGSIFYTKDTTLDDKTSKLKEEYKETYSDYNDLKARFNTLLEVVSTGIFFLNAEDKSIWFNDYLLEVLSLNYNTLKIEDFYSLIHPEDYKNYLKVMNECTKDKPTYEIRYRFKLEEGQYIFLKETSKAIFKADKLVFIAANVSVLSPIGFKKEDNDFLDNLAGENELLVTLNNLNKESKRYQLIYLRINNIPDINKSHGRQLGSVVLSDYVKTLANYFSSVDDFFRISGLDFVFIVRQDVKIQKLRKTLLEKNILTPTLTYGIYEMKMDCYLGIAFSKDGKSSDQVYKMAKDALEHACLTNESRHFLYYSELELIK